ncbi:hypothetical protein ACP4OV_020936 [Aristida adscensionis]
MAAHQACHDAGVMAGAAPAARRRVGLRRPSSASSLKKARMLRRRLAGLRPPATSSSRKRAAVIKRKMEALRTLVPVCRDGGGAAAGERLEELLLHAAGYIVRLQMQVRVMQVMVHALDNPDDY